jgi:hypothetical protein
LKFVLPGNHPTKHAGFVFLLGVQARSRAPVGFVCFFKHIFGGIGDG